MPSLVPAPSLLWGRGCICVRHCAGPGNTLSDFEKRLTVADFGGGKGGTPLVTGGSVRHVRQTYLKVARLASSSDCCDAVAKLFT